MTDEKTLTDVCPLLLTLIDGCNVGIDLKVLNNTATEEITTRIDRVISLARDLLLTLIKQLAEGTNDIFEEVKACVYTPNRYRYFVALESATEAFAATQSFVCQVTADTLSYDALGDLGDRVARIGRCCIDARALSEADLRRFIELFLSIEMHICAESTKN